MISVSQLFNILRTSNYSWLIVLDNADPTLLNEKGLLPPGDNPLGKVFLTTNILDPIMTANGQVVAAEFFTHEEATALIRGYPNSAGNLSRVAFAEDQQVDQLVNAIHFHPLALSIALRIITEEDLTISEWVEGFTFEPLKSAFDQPDPGGYRTLISELWQNLLKRASATEQDIFELKRAALVSAVQSENGYPKWIWEQDALLDWVTGGKVQKRKGREPISQKTLRRFSIADLDEANGCYSMHPLVARAIKESMDQQTIIECAQVLLVEWLSSQSETDLLPSRLVLA